ncbi:MAG: EAL domain-containing protein [Acidimicrobiales bacterium]
MRTTITTNMRERRVMRLWQVAAIAILVFGSVAVTVGTWGWYVTNRDHNRTQRVSNANQLARSVGATLEDYSDQTASTAALFSQPGLLTHAAFGTYVRQADLSGRYPGLRGVGFISLVNQGALPAFVAQARSDGLPNFTVVPAGSRPSYCVASYVEVSGLSTPFPLVGYDLCTVPTLSQQLGVATETGQVQVILEDTLASGAAYRGNFVLVVPVYEGSPRTAAQRQAQVVGWVAALVDGRELLGALGGAGSHTSLELFSGSTTEPSQLVVASPPGVDHTGANADVVQLDAEGRWTLRVLPLRGAPGPTNPLVAPAVVFFMALLLNIAMAGFVWDLGRGRLRAVRSFMESERRFQSIASCSPVGILELGTDGSTQYLNPRLEEIAGVDASFLEKRGWLACVHPDDRARVSRLARSVWPARDDVSASFRLMRPGGDVRHVRVLAAPVTTDVGTSDRYVATVQDVTDEVAANEALAFQAMHDHLTGLPNRALFLDRLNLELSNATRSGSGLAVMFLDLDRFKVINDGLGHQSGDDLLRAVANRLQRVVRSGETVARLGGDEFTFILHDIEGASSAAGVAERILAALAEPLVVADREVVITGSIGIVLPNAASMASTLLRDADAAMYRAKELGRSRFEIFDEEQRRAVVKRLTIEGELRRAIEHAELRLHYQPVVSLTSGEVLGAEALVRWEHPTRGILQPAEFIPVAEETGLIVPLGEWVFRTAAADLARWDDQGQRPRLEQLAVNVSARQLASPSLCPAVRDALSVSGVEAHRISVEVTESVIMTDDAVTRRSLSELRSLGVCMAIDDFGTGYSSLASLSMLPVGVVKIDKSFVDRIGREHDGGPIVTAVVQMAHALGMQVIAEGVSLDEQRRFLARCGCDQAQGFLWSPALVADEFVHWCAQWSARSEGSVARRRLVG